LARFLFICKSLRLGVLLLVFGVPNKLFYIFDVNNRLAYNIAELGRRCLKGVRLRERWVVALLQERVLNLLVAALLVRLENICLRGLASEE
jgi:hypothetical protein